MFRTFGTLFLGLTLLVAGCKKEDKADAYTDPSSIITDEFGRQLILHGLNTSSSAKYGDYLPWIVESDVEREHAEFGFNFVRLLTSWVAIEPERGVYNEAYLDQFAERVRWYTSRGMYVMIDMHQDVYGACVGGNGHPDWSCITDGFSELPLENAPWWLKNIDPRAIASWKNFWEYKEHQFLQDHYIRMWQKVASRFKDNPYVIGYDLMNEPWGGDLVRSFVTGDFERYDLAALYGRLIPAIREVDPEKYIFFEPAPAPVTFGAPSFLGRVRDARASQRLVYAPHMYPYGLHEGGNYNAKDRKNLQDWERERKKDQRTHQNAPLLCGEFGVSPSSQGYDEFLTEINNMFDRNQWHWAYWSNDKGGWSPLNADRTETPICNHLVRAYPKATAGNIRSFSFDPSLKVFRMTYLANPAITQGTDIFVPKRHFPNGWELKVTGNTNYTSDYNETLQLLTIKTEKSAEITVEITAK
jgi:endoglycosylceramidase